MKLFLTGGRQVGKSTAINRFLSENGLGPGGFRTLFQKEGDLRRLYMCPAADPRPAAGRLVATGGRTSMTGDPAAFDKAGPALLSHSGQICLLDELGYLEKDALAFRDAVFSLLDREVPVLGVLREGFPGWTAAVANRPDVEVLSVTEENRDSLPLLLRQRFFRLPPISAVVMASGHSHRFGGEKLLAPLEGQPLVSHLFRALPQEIFQSVAVVSRSTQILDLAQKAGLHPVYNDDRTDDTAKTIRLGLASIAPDSAGCMFFVADQPWLCQGTILRLCARFYTWPDNIHLPVHGGRRGNPVLFPRALFAELKNLPPQQTGKAVIGRHPDLVLEQETPWQELQDVDYASDLNISSKI